MRWPWTKLRADMYEYVNHEVSWARERLSSETRELRTRIADLEGLCARHNITDERAQGGERTRPYHGRRMPK